MPGLPAKYSQTAGTILLVLTIGMHAAGLTDARGRGSRRRIARIAVRDASNACRHGMTPVRRSWRIAWRYCDERGEEASMADKREGWLAELKVGDEVGVTWGWAVPTYHLTKVLRITPTGRLVVSLNGREATFNERGCSSGNGSIALSQVTPEFREKIERRELLRNVGRVRWNTLPIATLRAVLDAIGDEGKRYGG
jgi:hypothetical protein